MRHLVADRSNSAFTLIELLVVISVIAILAAIAFPVFQRVTEDGKEAKDLSNLRQIGMAASLHSSEHGFLMGEAWPSVLNPTYLTDWTHLQSAFDARPPNPADPRISYDLNSNLWGMKPDMILSRPDCIFFAPLMVDAAVPTFASTRDNPSQPTPLTIRSNGVGAKGGTYRNGSLITILFADMHSSSMHMSAFHSSLPNPDTESAVADIRWNK